jgi:tetratricopeptide (TPR) repeat protein
MRSERPRRLRRGVWGTLAAVLAGALVLTVVWTRPRGPMPAGELQPLPAEPGASILDHYLARSRAGIAAYHAGRHGEATRAFEAAIALQPAEHLPYRYLAELYWREGRREQALRAVRSLAQRIPDAYFVDHVGMAYEEVDLTGLAMLFYQEAVRLDPQLPSAHYNLGRAYLEAGDLERGIAQVQEALRLHPDFAEAHQALGMAFMEQGRHSDAIAHLERALALRPELTEVRNQLGRLYMAQGRLDKAIPTFQSLVERAPDVPEARHNLAVAFARRGLREQAIEQFREALRLRPEFLAARQDLATLLREMGRAQDAIDTLRPALASPLQERERRDQPAEPR